VRADEAAAREALEPATKTPELQLETKLNAQIVELAFLCLQFVALSGVFTSLNIPDEPFLVDVMQNSLPPSVIKHINTLCSQAGHEMKDLVPNRIEPPMRAIEAGALVVAPTRPKGRRVLRNEIWVGSLTNSLRCSRQWPTSCAAV
jgi:hypothetical protein